MKSFKSEFIADKMAKIHVAEVGYYYPNEKGGRFSYSIDGENHYMHIVGLKEQAEFLYTHGLISGYSETSLYIIDMMPVVKPDGSFTMWDIPRKVEWKDFYFTRDQVVRFAAVHEYNKAASQMGIVRNLFENVKKIAA